MSTSFFALAISVVATALSSSGLAASMAFGFWAGRRADLRSLPWLGIYLVLSSWPAIMLNAWALSRLTGGRFRVSSLLLTTLSIPVFIGIQQILFSLCAGLLAILVMADAAHLMERAGVKIDNVGVRVLIMARKYSFGLGIVAAILALLAHLVALSYRI